MKFQWGENACHHTFLLMNHSPISLEKQNVQIFFSPKGKMFLNFVDNYVSPVPYFLYTLCEWVRNSPLWRKLTVSSHKYQNNYESKYSTDIGEKQSAALSEITKDKKQTLAKCQTTLFDAVILLGYTEIPTYFFSNS